jgi:ArsR family transcriptional regulator
VIAVDQSDTMLEAARKRLASHENVDFVRSDLESLALDDASVDAVVAALVFHHISDPAAALREIARVLRPGGVAIIVDMVRHAHAEFRSKMGHVHLGFAPEDMVAMLEAAGLPGATTQYLPTDPEARGPGIFLARAVRPGAE